MAEMRKWRRCFLTRCENITAIAFSSIVKAMELKNSITSIPTTPTSCRLAKKPHTWLATNSAWAGMTSLRLVRIVL